MSTARKTLVVGLFLLGVVFLTRLVLRSQPSPDSLVENMLACSGESACLTAAVDAADIETIRNAVRPLVVATARSGSCHGVLHYLGAGLARSADTSMASLGEDWAVCGMGLMHGFVETKDFTRDDNPSQAALQFCDDWSGSDAIKNHLCQHALGHSFYRTADDTNTAEQLCLDISEPSASGSCLNGVYMMVRDDALSSTAYSHAEVMAVCDRAVGREHCLVMLFEPLVRRWGGLSEEVSSLAAECRVLYEGCESYLGRALAAASKDAATDLGACASSPEPEKCFAGFFESMAATGRDATELQKTACRRYGYCLSD